MITPRPRRILPLVLCLLAGLAAAPRAGASSKPSTALDLQAYSAALDRCAGEIARLRAHPEEIAAYRGTLPAAWDVRADGKTFEISTNWLDAALAEIQVHPEKAAATWRAIGRRLEFLRSQAAALESPAATPAPGVARERLAGIFKRGEFRGLAGPGPLARWWRRVTTWIGEHLERLLARLHLGAQTGNIVAYLLIGVAVVLLALWLWRSLAGRARQLELEFEPGEPARDARGWLGEALAAAERGEYREAIHCGYWAAVAHLEGAGAVPRDRSRTPRELARLLESRSGERGPFGELTARFERVWYGYRAPTAADWESMRVQLERMGCLGLSTAETASS
jgi:hypothetical protein